MNTQLLIPDLGVDEAEIVEIAIKVGDSVSVDQEILTLETDKASMEVPANAAGTLSQLDVKVGQMVRTGEVIGLLTADASAQDPEPAAVNQQPTVAAPQPAASASPEPAVAASVESESGQLLIPDLGVDEAEVVEIAIKVGDSVAVDQEILTLETDKASMEVPANVAGVVSEINLSIGQMVSSGMLVGSVQIAAASGAAGSPVQTEAAKPAEPTAAAVAAAPESPAPSSAAASKSVQSAPESTGGNIYAGPAVRKLAREFGVDLALLSGSGNRGRIVKQDVQDYVKNSLQQGLGTVAPSRAAAAPEIDFSQFGSVELRPMGKIQRLTADAMVNSLALAPQVSHHDQADISALEQLRQQSKEFAASQDVKLTIVPFLIKACALALQKFPEFNTSLSGGNIVQKHYVHIGMAVDSAHGLFVPVVRDCDKKSVFAIAREAAALAQKAQNKTLKPAEMQGGCFSISSLGALGGEYFTPIVNWPEAAILGVCRAQTRPVYSQGEFIPRLLLPLSLSYDHRLINGASAARFTSYLIELLANPGFTLS